MLTVILVAGICKSNQSTDVAVILVSGICKSNRSTDVAVILVSGICKSNWSINWCSSLYLSACLPIYLSIYHSSILSIKRFQSYLPICQSVTFITLFICEQMNEWICYCVHITLSARLSIYPSIGRSKHTFTFENLETHPFVVKYWYCSPPPLPPPPPPPIFQDLHQTTLAAMCLKKWGKKLTGENLWCSLCKGVGVQTCKCVCILNIEQFLWTRFCAL